MEEENLTNDQSLSESSQDNFVQQPNEQDNTLLKVLRSFFSGINRWVVITLASILITVFAIVFVIFIAPAITEKMPVQKSMITSDQELKNDAFYKKQISILTKDVQRLTRKYNAYTSGQSYIVINTTKNRFTLYRNRKVIREGYCSSGSYTVLKTADGERKWVFKTPKGKCYVRYKTVNPIWVKPDWAFVEEGLPIPSAHHSSRYEYGVLGKYSLALGDGYLIHGTIYQRSLGMPVTHGCVRLGDADLEAVYNTLNIGSKVYIF
ncbi:MAG TPA: L,D-transpeptidase [Bacteroidales bacterium]|nr:L,D-transpeptidase [Bacteroidales bacterium]